LKFKNIIEANLKIIKEQEEMTEGAEKSSSGGL